MEIGSTVFHDQTVITTVELHRRLTIHIRRIVLGHIVGCSLINFCMVASSTFVSPRSNGGIIGRRGRSGAISQTGEDGGTVVRVQPKLEVGVTSGGEIGRTEVDGSRSHGSDPSLEGGGGASGVEHGTIVDHG